mmetsp:Transcript_90517/g.180668  ORF Transcript_90517/g.180668 Transcript_90517/m.180668 type:complete len:127 (+) Transcript_90517:155-535(+)
MPGHLITVSSCGERFCLVPPGLEGSPISRRLFDALASGCIPISWQRPLRQLPTACLLGVRCAGVRWRCSQATCSASQNTSDGGKAGGCLVAGTRLAGEALSAAGHAGTPHHCEFLRGKVLLGAPRA